MTVRFKTLPRWAQWLVGFGLLAVALTAGGPSLAMNIAVGLAVGFAVAIAFTPSDVARSPFRLPPASRLADVYSATLARNSSIVNRFHFVLCANLNF